MATKSIYRLLGTGTLFMFNDNDSRLKSSLYSFITHGKRTRVPVQQPGQRYAGKLFMGDDGKQYVIYADWSASLMTPVRPVAERVS